MSDLDELPLPDRQFVRWVERGFIVVFGALVLAMFGFLWNARDTVNKLEVQEANMQREVDAIQADLHQRSSDDATLADLRRAVSDLQQQIDRRFKVVDDGQARIMSRLDEHMSARKP